MSRKTLVAQQTPKSPNKDNYHAHDAIESVKDNPQDVEL